MTDNSALANVFEQELGSFLDLASGEIKLSMKDATGSIQMLTKTFMEMVRDVHEIKAIAEEMRREKDLNRLEEIIKTCDGYLDKVQDGTTGFQFYDKLTQRLTHTSESMKQLRDLIEEPTKLQDEKQWLTFKNDLEKRYNTETDRKFFQAMMEGSSIKEAIRIALESRDKSHGEGSVELF